MLWELPKNRAGLSVLQPDQDYDFDREEAEHKPKLLPWMAVAAALLALLGVSLVAQLALVYFAPYAQPLGVNLFALGRADYSPWDADDNPGLAARTNTDPVEASEGADLATPVSIDPVLRPRVGNPMYIPIVLVPAGGLLSDDDDDGTGTRNTPTPTRTRVPTRTPTPTPTRSSIGLADDDDNNGGDDGDSLPAVTRTAGVSTQTPQPSATPESSAPSATATTQQVPPIDVNTDTPVPQPSNTPQPEEPTNTRTPRPTRTTGPTNTPKPLTSTPTPGGSNPPVVTFTFTPEPEPEEPTATPTHTPVPEPPTATPTHTPVPEPPTATPTHTPVPETFVEVFFSNPTYRVNEGEGTVLITVRLSEAAENTVTVNYSTSDGSAVAGSDYVSSDDTLFFSPGVTQQTFSVPIIDDPFNEPEETLRLVLNAPTGEGVLGVPRVATLTIDDNDNVPTVNFEQTEYTFDEDAGTVTINVILSEPAEEAITVDYLTVDGSAAAGIDYADTSGRLTFQPGVTQQSFTLPIIDNPLDQADARTLQIGLVARSGNVTVGAAGTATVTINDDDDPPLVAFAQATGTVNEGSGSHSVIVRLDAPSGKTVSVRYSTSSGTATAGSDFSSAGGTLIFAPGITQRAFTVPIIDDALDEDNETLVLSLTDPNNAALGPLDNATLTIVDNDDPPAVRFEKESFVVDEGAGAAVITVALAAPSGKTVTVQYSSSDETATASSDYTAVDGRVTFEPGDPLVKTFTVPIINDTLDEPEQESVRLQLTNPTNATLGTPNPALLLISDNDQPPAVRFVNTPYSVNEGAGTATIRVGLTAASQREVSINYLTASGGTATAPEDYTSGGGRLVFNPGDPLVKSFTVPIIDDDVYEGNETVILRLEGPVNVRLGTPGQATLTIIDNDALPQVSFSQASYGVLEEAGTANITVVLDKPSSQTVRVLCSTSDGTATAPDDYTAVTQELVFAPGDTEQICSIPIKNDTIYESPAETLNLLLSDPSNAELAPPSTAQLTIEESLVIRFDPSVPRSSQPSYPDSPEFRAAEGDTAVITVTLNAPVPTGQEVRVSYRTLRSGTGLGDDSRAAEPDIDFENTTGTLVFPEGTDVQTFTVPIFTDTLDENTEATSIRLFDEVNARIDPTSLGFLLMEDRPTVEFDAATYTVNEDDTDVVATVRINRYGDTSGTNTVELLLADGDPPAATAGVDYDATPILVTFNPGESFKDVDITISGDTISEANENIALTLGNPSGVAISGQGSAVLTIIDDEGVPTVGFSSATYTVTEDVGTASVDVALSNPSVDVITVECSTSNGSAVAPGDYTTVTAQVITFNPGDTLASCAIPINDDINQELDEDLNLSLANASNANLGSSSATLTIEDNDLSPTVSFSSATYSVGEGVGTARITVTLSAETYNTVTVECSTSNGTAVAPDDYTAVTGQVITFNPGDTVATCDIPIINDILLEPNQNIALNLTNPVNATLGTSSATLTIIENDVVPDSSTLSPNVACVADLGGGNYRAFFTYTNLNEKTVNIIPGDPSNSFNPTPANRGQPADFVPGGTTHPASSFSVDYDGGTLEWTLNSNTVDADISLAPPACVPVISLNPASYTVDEDGGSIIVTVEIASAPPAGSPVEVTYATADATATAGLDYTAVSGTLTFNAGDPLTQTVSIPLLDDILVEGDENFRLVLSSPVNGTLDSADFEADVVIVEDDATPSPVTPVSSDLNDLERFFVAGGSFSEGDWYIDDGPGYHEYSITIPPGWPAGTPVHVDLFHPNISGSTDNITGTNDTTITYELTGPGVAGTISQSYPPATLPDDPTDPASWSRLATINPPTPSDPPTPGTYTLRVFRAGDDDNAWWLSVGSDSDGDMTTIDGPDGPDGQPGTNDEILIGLDQVVLGHNTTNVCQALYEYVPPGTASITLHNHDIMEISTETMWYISPGGDTYDGTESEHTKWNNGDEITRGGDVILNPEPGWWQIRACTIDKNQYINEGQQNVTAYLEQPPTPAMTVAVDDGVTDVTAGTALTYVISFDNTSDATAVPGTANAVVIRVTLDPNVTYTGCNFNPSYSGTCSESGGVVTFTLDQTILPGESGSVTVQADAGGTPGTVLSTEVALDYEDSLGNTFVPAEDSDTTSIP